MHVSVCVASVDRTRLVLEFEEYFLSYYGWGVGVTWSLKPLLFSLRGKGRREEERKTELSSLLPAPPTLIPSIPTNNKMSNKGLSFLFVLAFHFLLKEERKTNKSGNEKGSV